MEALRGMTTETLVKYFESIFTFIIGLIAGVIFCPEMTLILFCLSPIMVGSMLCWSRLHWKKTEKGSDTKLNSITDSYEKSNALLSDLILNYRTVIGFGQKNIEQINQKFSELLEAPVQHKEKEAKSTGIAFGFSQSGRVIFLGAAFTLGFYIAINYFEVPTEKVFKGIYVPFFAFMGVGASAANIPSIETAKNKAKPIFNFIDEKSTLDARKIQKERISALGEGHIQLKNTLFAYPSKKKPVLNNMNLDIPASAKIALIGHSGCGKSTITNLLLRFYNIQGGNILIDDHKFDMRLYVLITRNT